MRGLLMYINPIFEAQLVFSNKRFNLSSICIPGVFLHPGFFFDINPSIFAGHLFWIKKGTTQWPGSFYFPAFLFGFADNSLYFSKKYK